MFRPFFSIITATYNVEKTLPRLLDSLAAQTCQDFDWIMQDGSSTDHTVAIAEAYRGRLPEILLQSAPDAGIYDAWNKALDSTRDQLGAWVLFLGADDLLAEDTVLEKAKTWLSASPENLNYCCGDIIRFTEDRSISKKVCVDMQSAFNKRHKKMTLLHPSLFNRATLFANNIFDSGFKVAKVYEFLVRTWKKILKHAAWDLPSCVCL